MSSHSFRSIFMVASCAGAALGCYLVSLRVASERSALEDVETRIVMTQRDIRTLQTEIGTRGRLAQLERWNVKVLALSAPSADQFLGGSFELAKLTRPIPKIDPTAPVVMAAAPADAPRPTVKGVSDAESEAGVSATQLLHTASLTREIPPAAPSLAPNIKPPAETIKKSAKPAGPKPAVDKPAKAVAALGKTVAAKPAERKVAAIDPLAPLPEAKAKPKAGSAKTADKSATTKGSAKKP